MYKYKSFIIPLLLSIILILFFSLYQYTSINNSTASYTNVESENKDASFFIASDIHYFSNELTDYGDAFEKFVISGDGKQLNYISNIFDSFIYDISKFSPNFLILSGDLTLNGEKESHLKLASKLSEIEKLGTTVFVIPGNHDINNPWARKFSVDKQYKINSISSKEFNKIYNEFGFKEAISRDSDSLSYLVAPTKGMWLLMLDDNKYSNNLSYNMPDMSGSLSQNTLKWISECGSLAKENNAKLAVVTHHNLINHSDYVWDGYTLDNNLETLSVFKACDIRVAFTGHIHVQSIKQSIDNNYSFTDISTASLAVYPQKYGVFKLSSDSTSNYWTNTINVDEYSKSINQTDTNLLTFNTYSRDFYSNFIYKQNYKNLLSLNAYSTDEIKSMCETLKNIRLKYDSNLDEISWETIRSSKGFSLLQNCNSVYMKHYVKIATDGNVDGNNKIELNL